MAKTLQERVESGGSLVRLKPDEYRGPLVISKPCTVDGSGSTIWSETGPVLCVKSPGVTLQNMRIEVTGPGRNETALQCDAPGTVLKNVEVYGAVAGVPGEENAAVPRTIDLGIFAAGRPNTFVRRLMLPAPTRLRADLAGVRVEPGMLERGKAELRISTGEMAPGTSVYGEIFLESAVQRRIYVRGRAEEGAPQISEASERALPAHRKTDAPRRQQAGSALLRKGERRDIPGETAVEVRLTGVPPAGVDAYVFCLGAGEKVRRDEDLIFFGQLSSPDGAVRVLPDGIAVRLNLGKLDPDTERLVIAFSGYEQAIPRGEAELIVKAGGEVLTYSLTDLGGTRTVAALELYRRGSGWKVWVTDYRSQAGIEALCAQYGVEIA
ncbi:MAG: hypothetical protein HDQ87_00875 [Clostridia bacterium]|nr:hypothetical protein [Clostridia bacterium]